MQRMQEESKKKTVEATAGGGMVTVIANGGGEIISIKIEKDVVNPDDVEMLQDLNLPRQMRRLGGRRKWPMKGCQSLPEECRYLA